MYPRVVTWVCGLAALGLLSVWADAWRSAMIGTEQVLEPFEFRREAASTPEMAAQAMFLGVATASPQDFVKHLLLGVCHNEVDVLRTFAESLHVTPIRHEGETSTWFQLQERPDASGKLRVIDREEPVRVLSSIPFDSGDAKVRALRLEAASTHAGERFVCVEVAGVGYYDRADYQACVVVAQVDGGWYAIPRCRNSARFYEIADTMRAMDPERQADR
jgi:hypothetical protein